MKFRILSIIFLSLFLASSPTLHSQILGGSDLPQINYNRPATYTIGGISVTGVQYLDHNVIIVLSGLSVGDRIEIPGERIRQAIEKLWRQGLFENIRITATGIEGDIIYLNLSMQERPRLREFRFRGVKKSEADDLKDKANLVRNDVVTENLILRTENIIKRHFSDKGFMNTEVNIIQVRDTLMQNYVELIIEIDKKSKVRIEQINIFGNTVLPDDKIRRQMKDTKEKGYFKPFDNMDSLVVNMVRAAIRLDFIGVNQSIINSFSQNLRPRIFKASRLIEDDFKTDKRNIIAKYNELGYRDAAIVGDSVYKTGENLVSIDLHIYEGSQYHFGNIRWIGNTKYSSEVLDAVLGIRKGDVFNQKILETNLMYNPQGIDVSSLYLDDGYLFFRVVPVEVRVENDTIDLEMRIFEGKQATINKVSIRGNTKTNDHVVIREIRTKPGQLFSRNDIIRSVRDLSQLGYFNPESLNPIPIPNQDEGTVDIIYEVEETSSDQIELSGGWGYGRIIGTVGLSFNNFSAKNIFNGQAWRPVPGGDGQKLSLRLQSHGRGFFSYSFSFTEPWLGGNRPTSLSLSYSYSRFTTGVPRGHPDYGTLVNNGFNVMLGKRLKWPDDFFILVHNAGLQRYSLNNYGFAFPFGTAFGDYYAIIYGVTFGRKSVDQPIFPRSGSDLTLSLTLTPPYSLFNDKDYQNMPFQERYKWIEYHKWLISASWFQAVAGNLVVNVRMRYGFLGLYSREIGVTPFERYFLGGDGLSGFYNLDGREIIAFRGYTNFSLTADFTKNPNLGATIYNKNTLEVRYPLTLSPSATIYMLGFVEAGNSWRNFPQFNPFQLFHSAGVGMRVFLPMFGLLGVDWGYGFEPVPGIPNANKGHFHFSIGQSLN